MADPNPGGWAPHSSSSSGKKSLPVAVIVAVVILIVGGATGGILWATGVFGSSGDDLVGVWYDNEYQDGIQFKADGTLVGISEGSPDSSMQAYGSFTWSSSGDKLTLTATQHILTENFECDDGQSLSRYYVNDGEDDCEDGEDEGVDVTKYPHETMTYSAVMKYEIVGDVLFIGMLEATSTQDGSTTTESILESEICSTDNSDCSASVRSTAMNNMNHATVVSGVTAPDWWEETIEDDY
jgi:hypothetical protein